MRRFGEARLRLSQGRLPAAYPDVACQRTKQWVNRLRMGGPQVEDDLQAQLNNRDSQVRLRVLDASARVEADLIAVAVFYLGRSSAVIQEAVDTCISGWGGVRVALDLLRTALPLHGVTDGVVEDVQAIEALRALRNLIAHSQATTIHWANEPDIDAGREGRQLLNRSRRGEVTWKRIEFDDAEATVRAALQASDRLCRTLAEVARGNLGTHQLSLRED